MNSDNFSFRQTTFPFTETELQVQGNKVRLRISQLFKGREMTFNLDEIDENSEQIFQRAYGWLAFLVVFGTGSMLHFLFRQFKPEWTGDWSTGIFLLLAFGISLYGYLRGTFNRLTYNTLSRQGSFHLYVNKPNKAAFEAFASRFNEMLVWSRKRRELCSTIQNFPTDFLKEDFAVFYAEELLRRGVDIYQLLSSVKKECLVNYIPESLTVRTLN